MRAKHRALRVTAIVAAVVLLLLPAFVVGYVWTAINLFVAAAAVLIAFAGAMLVPKAKWAFAAAGSLLIAIPPYPNWLWSNEEHGWHLRLGYKLQHLEWMGFAIHFAISMLLFALIFWAIGQRQPGSS